MDQGVAPTVTFDPDLESTLTGQTGRWTDAQTYVVEAVVADADFDADEVTIDITGAQDVAGNIQEDHTATVGLSVDTQNPTSSSITIDVADSDQNTDGDAAESFTVSTSDLDPGMLHVEMRGSEFTALTSIKSDYLNDVSAKIGGLQTAASDAQGFEGALTAAEEARDAFFNNATASDPSGSAAVFSTSGDIDVEASRVEGIAAELSRLEDVSSDADGARDGFFTEGNPGAGHASSAEIGAEAGRVEGLGDVFAGLETALSDAQGDRDVFFTDGAGAGHASSTEIGDEALRVEGLETALSDAQDDFVAFFDDSTDPVGPGSAFDDIQAIGDEASRLETKAATLKGSAADEMNEAAAALRDLEVEAQGLEDAIADAQGEVDGEFENLADLQSFAAGLRAAETEAQRLEGEVSGAQDAVDGFFVDGAGAEFDDIGDLQSVVSDLRTAETEAQRLEDAASDAQGMVDNFFADGEGSEFADRSAMDTAISDLRGLEGQGQIAEGNIVTAQDNLAAFFSGLNSDSALNLKDGTVYTVSGDIADEAAALETLLNGDEDAVYSADRVTGFLESQDRAIADLDDLNGQIDHSVVMREMSVSDAAPQLVSLDEAEVDRLGEGSFRLKPGRLMLLATSMRAALPRAAL